MIGCRVWGADCENVGSQSPTCPPPTPSASSCRASSCAEFYHDVASSCGTFCRADDSCLGHYTCDPATGGRVCLDGWNGPNCTLNVATQSSECTCRNGGTWLNGVCVGEVS